jgi:hypothetical protein
MRSNDEVRGDIDAADVEIEPNPNFVPEVVEGFPNPEDILDLADDPEG